MRTLAAVASVALLLSAAPASAVKRNGFVLDDALVPVREILRGGPPRDGIPSIDRPRFVAAGAVDFLADDDRVVGLDVAGGTRAYPIRILNWHEIVNDRIGEGHYVISYCPLCGTAMVFVVSGETTFGVSGLLYNSDMLLYDRATESLWSQVMARAISGPRKGERLRQVPAEHTTWADWRRRHPDSAVLSTATGYRIDYRRSPYGNYESSRQLMFPVARRSRRYHPKEWVLGVTLGGTARAYPFSELAAAPPRFEDEVGGERIVVSYDAASDNATVTRADGTPIPATRAFWFAWYAFHPDTEVYRAAR